MKNHVFILLLCAIFSLISCNKKTTPEVGENPIVYVAGSASTQEVWYATIWKDGVATALSDKTNPNEAATGNSVYVDDNNDVYVAGFTLKDEGPVAKMWKTAQKLN